MVAFSAELVVQDASSAGKKRKRMTRYMGELSFNENVFTWTPSESLGSDVQAIT